MANFSHRNMCKTKQVELIKQILSADSELKLRGVLRKWVRNQWMRDNHIPVLGNEFQELCY